MHSDEADEAKKKVVYHKSGGRFMQLFLSSLADLCGAADFSVSTMHFLAIRTYLGSLTQYIFSGLVVHLVLRTGMHLALLLAPPVAQCIVRPIVSSEYTCRLLLIVTRF